MEMIVPTSQDRHTQGNISAFAPINFAGIPDFQGVVDAPKADIAGFCHSPALVFPEMLHHSALG